MGLREGRLVAQRADQMGGHLEDPREGLREGRKAVRLEGLMEGRKAVRLEGLMEGHWAGRMEALGPVIFRVETALLPVLVRG